MMYYTYDYRNNYNTDNRFIVPFLLGGLAGGALVGVSRPRPVYVNNPNQMSYYNPYQVNPYYMPHGTYNSSYYGYY